MIPVFNSLTLIIVLVLFGACTTKESIDPSVESTPIVFNLSLPVTSLEVEDQFSEIEEVNVIGGVFRELAEMMADAEIDQGDLGEIGFSPCVYEVPEVDSVDFDFVKGVRLNKVLLKIESDDETADFSFLESGEVFIKMLGEAEFFEMSQKYAECGDSAKNDDPVQGYKIPEEGMERLLSFDEENGAMSENKKELNPHLHIQAWRERLMEKKYVLIFSRVKLKKSPTFEFTLNGSLDMSFDITLKN